MKQLILGVAIILIVIAGVVLFVRNNDDKNPSGTNNTPTNNSANTDTNNQQPSQDTDQTSSVTIEDSAFSPSTITIKKGTTVTWTNRDNIEHDVTPDSESVAFEGSELLSKNETYSFTFNTVGTYTYHCTPHPQMKGTVVVTE